MTIFASLYRHTLGRIGLQTPEGTTKAPPSRKRKLAEDEDDNKEAISRRRKRTDSEEDNEIITKRRRVDQNHFAPIVDGQTYESTLIEAPSGSHAEAGTTDREVDRMLMPPPALTPIKTRTVSQIIDRHSRRTSMDVDSVSQLSLGTKATQQRTSDDFKNDYDMEKARRHAAATTLPPNSGVWERGEKELFFHLSYRGFEPLLPKNWMKDFPTMPLSLYEADDGEEPPLIQVKSRKGEFRAIRELRELMDLGKNVRDKVLASPSVRTDNIIERATKKYINWALNDVGIKVPSGIMSSSTALPLHVVVRLKAGQTTTDCLQDMKDRLHALRTQHCRARNIHASVERDGGSYHTPQSEEEETWIAEDSDEDLPVLYGIMICKSILAIFTLNSRAPAPTIRLAWPSVHDNHRPSPAATEPIYGDAMDSVMSIEADQRHKNSLMADMRQEEQLEDDSASDPRFISDFDFSDPAKDVWNALVIAILAMQVRADMSMIERRTNDYSLEDITAGLETNSLMDMDEDDLDA